jgi:hypothetical protein
MQLYYVSLLCYLELFSGVCVQYWGKSWEYTLQFTLNIMIL